MNLRLTITALLFLGLSDIVAQPSTEERQEIVDEGKKLYRLEMASWYGTDVFQMKFADKVKSAGGYCSYETEQSTVCVFFTRAEPKRVLASIAFDSTFSTESAVVDPTERALSKQEASVIAMRQVALKEINADTLFKTYPDTQLNLIPVIDEKGRRVYVVTGPTKNGVIIFGNDYLLAFDESNNLQSKSKIHQNIIPIDFGNGSDKKVIGSSHAHLPETGDMITPTDICTLMLYQRFTQWKTHIVTSWKYLSLWDCEHNTLTLIPQKDLNKSVKD
jgi:hypothetical protein